MNIDLYDRTYAITFDSKKIYRKSAESVNVISIIRLNPSINLQIKLYNFGELKTFSLLCKFFV